MKKNTFFYLILLTTFIVSCTKNNGPIPKEIVPERVPIPLVVRNGGSAAIDMTNLAAFSGKFDVGIFFQSDVPPSKYDVVIRKNNNNGNVKLIQAGVTTFPTTFTITAAQIATFFGSPIALGDNYDISVDVYTLSGKKLDAFPPIGNGYAAGVQGQPGASVSVRYSAICQYNSSVFQGNFVVVEDEFQDTNPGDVLVLTRIDDTHFSFVYPSPIDPVPIIVTINPNTNATSITRQQIGIAFNWQPAYTNPFAQSVASLENVVLPCDQSFSVLINFTVDQGNFGNYLFKMKKQ
jgi:hypothetical protein